MSFRATLSKLVLSALMAAASAQTAPAAFTITYDFNGQPGDQASTNGVVSPPQLGFDNVGPITRGAGLRTNIGASSINSAGFSIGALYLADFYGFTVTPAAGTRLDLNTLAFTSRRSSTGVRAFNVRSSLDDYAVDIFAQSLPNTDVTRRDTFAFGPAFDSVLVPLTLRIYGYQADADGGTWRLGVSTGINPNNLPANLTLSGDVVSLAVATPLPPTALAFLAVALTAVIRRRAVR